MVVGDKVISDSNYPGECCPSNETLIMLSTFAVEVDIFEEVMLLIVATMNEFTRTREFN